MGEAMEAIEGFLSGGAESAEAASPAVTAETGVDTSDTKDVAQKAVSKKKSPLRVIQGGAKGLKESTPKLSDMPTPGGIGVLLFTVIFILFAFTTNASGYTRLQLLWAAFMGNATLGGVDTSTGTSTASTQTGDGSLITAATSADHLATNSRF